MSGRSLSCCSRWDGQGESKRDASPGSPALSRLPGNVWDLGDFCFRRFSHLFVERVFLGVEHVFCRVQEKRVQASCYSELYAYFLHCM